MSAPGDLTALRERAQAKQHGAIDGRASLVVPVDVVLALLAEVEQLRERTDAALEDTRMEAIANALERAFPGCDPDGYDADDLCRFAESRGDELREALAAAEAVVEQLREKADVLPDDEVCACLNDTGSRTVRIYERCERCKAFMASDALEAAEAEVEQLREERDVQVVSAVNAKDAALHRAEAAEAVVEQQTAALLRYGTHEPGCAHLEGYGSGCSCGLAAAVRAGAEPGTDG